MRHVYLPMTDRNEDGSATVCSQCERPDECGLTEVAHAGGLLHLCGVCFDELTPCENCGERGGTPREHVELDDEVGYGVLVSGCSRCFALEPPAKCPQCVAIGGTCPSCRMAEIFTSEECPF